MAAVTQQSLTAYRAAEQARLDVSHAIAEVQHVKSSVYASALAHAAVPVQTTAAVPAPPPPPPQPTIDKTEVATLAAAQCREHIDRTVEAAVETRMARVLDRVTDVQASLRAANEDKRDTDSKLSAMRDRVLEVCRGAVLPQCVVRLVSHCGASCFQRLVLRHECATCGCGWRRCLAV